MSKKKITVIDIAWTTKLQPTCWSLFWLLLSVAFTPTIPNAATDCNTINRAMVNFQNVISQKGLDYGPLWCGEGIYRIWQHLLRNWWFSFWKIFFSLLWSTLARDCSEKYITREWDITSWICKVSDHLWRL